MEQDNKPAEHHEQPKKRGIASGIIHHIQPRNITRELTLMNGGVRMDFTGRDVLKNESKRRKTINRDFEKR